jgi:hypothetical protein
MDLRVRTRVLALSAGGLIAVGLGAHLVLGHLHERDARAAAFHALRAVARSFEGYEDADVEKLNAAADALASNEALRRAFVARDRAALQAAAAPVFQLLRARGGITHLYFIDPDRTCFLRVHAPELHGDRIDRVTLAVAQRSGDVGAGKELGRTAFALRVVRPWRDPGGAVIGYVELGEEIEHFLARMKQQTRDDFAIVVQKKFLDEAAWAEMSRPARSTWNDRPDVVVVQTTTFTSGIVDFRGDVGALRDGGAFLDEHVEDGRALVRGVFPVRDAADRQVGAMFVLHDFTELRAAYQAAQERGLFVVLGLAVAVLVLLGVALERLVFAPLERVRSGLEPRGGSGESPQRPPSPPRAADASPAATVENVLAQCGPAEDLARGEVGR